MIGLLRQDTTLMIVLSIYCGILTWTRFAQEEIVSNDRGGMTTSFTGVGKQVTVMYVDPN